VNAVPQSLIRFQISTFMKEDVISCHAMRAWRSGEQVFIHYGDRPNVQLFSHNGFIVDENENDVFLISKSPEDTAAPRASDRSLLVKSFIPSSVCKLLFSATHHLNQELRNSFHFP
jgi:hypothetical protein